MDKNISTLQELLDTPTAKLKQKAGRDVAIQRGASSQITIPENLAFRAAGEALLARAEQDEMEVVRVEHFDCHPNDGLVALTRILRETFGWVGASGIASFFGNQPPAIFRLPTGVDTTEEVFGYGDISHPLMPEVSISVSGNVPAMLFTMVVRSRQKHGAQINALFDEVKQRLLTDSIYKGKTINSKFVFMRLGETRPWDIILAKETEEQVWANIFTPLSSRSALARYGIPFKRGVLMEGPYGGGKSLTATAAAKLANDNGISFIYVAPEDFEQLETHLRYARQYAPAVVFFEDIDSVLAGTERDSGVNMILDTLDGLESKGGTTAQDIMVIMTTNHVERLNPALLRPGRLDAVVHMGNPDAEAAAKLVRMYGKETLASDIDLAEVGAACDGMAPAFIREIVERAKLHSLRRDPNITPQLSTADLLASAHGIQTQLRLARPPASNPSAADKFAGAFGELVASAVDKTDIIGMRGEELGVLATNHKRG